MAKMRVDDVDKVTPEDLREDLLIDSDCLTTADHNALNGVSPLPPGHIPPYDVLFSPPSELPEVMVFELTCTECGRESKVRIEGSLGLSPHCAICNSENFDVNYVTDESNVDSGDVVT